MSFRVRCGTCGAVYIAGAGHKCAARRSRPADNVPSVKNVKNTASVKNAAPVKNGTTSSARTAKWREANREKSRRYIREYMRRKRAG
jgi:hypothetical protein